MDTPHYLTVRQVETKQRIKNTVYDALGGASYWSGLTWARRRFQTGPVLRVLVYYKINAIRGNTLSVTPETFARQMQFLHERYHVISPQQMSDVIRHGAVLPQNAVLITFDDGYRDVYERAYPVLQRFGFKALLFPATDYIGSTDPFPHDERLPMKNPALTWSQLRAMQDVFSIGSHTKSHRVLTRMPLPEAQEEIYASKALLEERLGNEVMFFSYPKGAAGDFSARLEDSLRAAGYQASFVTLTGPNSMDHVRRGRWLRRYMVEPFCHTTFSRLLDGSCDAIGLKDIRWGVSCKRAFNRVLGTTSR